MYAENVTVSNPMTIDGQSQSGVTVVPVSGGGNMQNAFLVASSDVTIENLTIDGKTNTSSTDNFDAGVITDYDGSGGLNVAVTAYNDLTAQHLTIQNTLDYAVRIATQGTGNKILDNTISNISGSPSWGMAEAIVTIGGDATISGNTITDTGSTHTYDMAIGTNARYDTSGTPTCRW